MVSFPASSLWNYRYACSRPRDLPFPDRALLPPPTAEKHWSACSSSHFIYNSGMHAHLDEVDPGQHTSASHTSEDIGPSTWKQGKERMGECFCVQPVNPLLRVSEGVGGGVYP